MVYREKISSGLAIYYANPHSDCELYRGSLIRVYNDEELSHMDQVEYDPGCGKYLAGNYYFDFPEAGSKYLHDGNAIMASGRAYVEEVA